MSTQRTSHTQSSGQAAVTRLAWIAEDSAALMLLRLPLLRAVVQRRHKVLALVPGLTPPHRLTLLAHGIESAALPVPRRSIGPFANPFAHRRARAELVDILSEWRTNTAVLDCHGLQDFVWRSCLLASVPAIHPVSPAMDLHPESTRALRSWATLATPETKAFAATANDVRLVSAALSKRSPSFHILPPVALDLSAIKPEPLPPLESGIVFLGLTAGSAGAAVSSYAGAAKIVQTRTSRARFQLAQIGPNQAATHHATDTSRLEHFEIDQIGRAHV